MTAFRYHQLRALGRTHDAIRRDARSGELGRVRHGGYSLDEAPDTAEQRHRLLLATTVPLLTEVSALSHASAGLLWGLPVPSRLLTRVHVTRDGASGGTIRTSLHRHVQPLGEWEITDLNGMRVTSLARTAIDLGCQVRRDEALAIMDAAWRQLGGADELVERLALPTGRRGIGAARWAIAHANPLAESPGESLSRYLMIVHQVKLPLLQYEVRDQNGRLIGQSDFAWPEHGVLGEFDGRVKYEQDVDAVMREKQRENRLRNLGWWVLRWTWADLADGEHFAGQITEFIAANPRSRTA